MAGPPGRERRGDTAGASGRSGLLLDEWLAPLPGMSPDGIVPGTRS